MNKRKNTENFYDALPEHNNHKNYNIKDPLHTYNIKTEYLIKFKDETYVKYFQFFFVLFLFISSHFISVRSSVHLKKEEIQKKNFFE